MYVILVVVDYMGGWDRLYSCAAEAAVRAEEIGGQVVPWMVLRQGSYSSMAHFLT